MVLPPDFPDDVFEAPALTADSLVALFCWDVSAASLRRLVGGFAFVVRLLVVLVPSIFLGLALTTLLPGGRPGFLFTGDSALDVLVVSEFGMRGPSLCSAERRSPLVGEGSSHGGGGLVWSDVCTIKEAVSSISPRSSAWRSRSLRAALSDGSAHIVYWFMAALTSPMASSIATCGSKAWLL